MVIDINADVGERPDYLDEGSEEMLIRLLTSANVACGGHAGDEASMRAAVRFCGKYGVSIGAHPSYPDRENFGRMEMDLAGQQVERCVYDQVSRLARIAREEGRQLVHVKPHGALYSSAAKSIDLAAAIARAAQRVSRELVLVGLAGSRMLEVWLNEGFAVAAEAFADRRYESDGSLRPRRYTDSMIEEPVEAARQALRIVRNNSALSVEGVPVGIRAQTICVHGDTPGALEIVIAVRDAFRKSAIEVAPLRRLK